jgi:hypothetical protein
MLLVHLATGVECTTKSLPFADSEALEPDPGRDIKEHNKVKKWNKRFAPSGQRS